MSSDADLVWLDRPAEPNTSRVPAAWADQAAAGSGSSASGAPIGPDHPPVPIPGDGQGQEPRIMMRSCRIDPLNDFPRADQSVSGVEQMRRPIREALVHASDRDVKRDDPTEQRFTGEGLWYEPQGYTLA